MSKIYLFLVLSLALSSFSGQVMANPQPLPEHNLGADPQAFQAIQQFLGSGYACAVTRHPGDGPYYVALGATQTDAIQAAQAISLKVDGFSNNYACWTMQSIISPPSAAQPR